MYDTTKKAVPYLCDGKHHRRNLWLLVVKLRAVETTETSDVGKAVYVESYKILFVRLTTQKEVAERKIYFDSALRLCSSVCFRCLSRTLRRTCSWICRCFELGITTTVGMNVR